MHMGFTRKTRWIIGLSSAVCLVTVALYAGPVLAAHGLEGTADIAGLSELETSPARIIGRLVGSLLGFTGVIILILLIYAGSLWMTAAGNEERIGKAKKIIVGSIVGAVIIIGAYAITSFVIDVVSPSDTEGETAGDVEYAEGDDYLEEALTPEEELTPGESSTSIEGAGE